jgi:hypothetical protein
VEEIGRRWRWRVIIIYEIKKLMKEVSGNVLEVFSYIFKKNVLIETFISE